MKKELKKAGRKKIDPTKVKKNVTVYITQQKIDEHGGIDSLKEKINFFIDNMHPIKFEEYSKRKNVLTMQNFVYTGLEANYVLGFYEGSETITKIPNNVYETFFR